MKTVTVEEVKNGLIINGHFKKYDRYLGALKGVDIDLEYFFSIYFELMEFNCGCKKYEYGSHNIILLYGENTNTSSSLNIQPRLPMTAKKAQSLKDKFIACIPTMLNINYEINRDFRIKR